MIYAVRQREVGAFVPLCFNPALVPHGAPCGKVLAERLVIALPDGAVAANDHVCNAVERESFACVKA